MKQLENMLDSQLEDWFSSLRPITPRAPQAAQRGKNNFLAQGQSISAPVSKMTEQRHTRWIYSLQKYFKSKEYSPMYATIASFVLVLALMFGGTGATVLAAQDSLPNQPLYQVKTFAEDLALRYTFRSAQRFQMELDYAARRLTEMAHLGKMGQEVPEATFQRLEEHLDQALIIAAQFEEAEMIRALHQIRERLQLYIETIPDDLDHDPLMIRIREMVQSRLSWAESGLDEPNEFRHAAQIRTRFELAPQNDNNYGPGPGPFFDPVPGEEGFSPGPQAQTPKNEDCQNENCDPAAEGKFAPGPHTGEGHPEDKAGPNQEPAGDYNHEQGSDADQNPDSGMEGSGSSSNPDPAQGDGSNKGNGGKP